MKKILVGLVTVLALSACGSVSPPANPTDDLSGNATAIDVRLTNPKWVTCVVYNDSNTGTEFQCLDSTIRDTK